MPFHTRRVWQVVDVESAEELAAKLTGEYWVLCQGFRFGGFLWLNDATSEDGASEWAVVRILDRRQVESVTFGWVDSVRGLEIIREIVATGNDGPALSDRQLNPHRAETPERHGRCSLCA